MCNNYTKNDCHNCEAPPERSGGKVHASLVGNILLVLMPKCSFCVLAYTSTMLLCTREETLVASSLHASPLTICITAALCLFIMGGILLNRRGPRTWYALAFAIAGMVMMITSVAWGGGEALYYAGNAIVFVGIWMNGSLMSAWRQLKQAWNHVNGLEPARTPGNL
jgi:hypothetical protein